MIEFLFPNLYEMVDRAEAAFNQHHPEHPEDPESVTNYRWLKNLREITFFWLQDAVELLETSPEIGNAAPWKWLLQSPKQKQNLERLGADYMEVMNRHRPLEEKELLTQQQNLAALYNGSEAVSQNINRRLSLLPDAVASSIGVQWNEEMARMKAGLKQEMNLHFRGVCQQMFKVLSMTEVDGSGAGIFQDNDGRPIDDSFDEVLEDQLRDQENRDPAQAFFSQAASSKGVS